MGGLAINGQWDEDVRNAAVPQFFHQGKALRAVATGGISVYIPPKSVYLKFFMWLFCLLAMTS